MSWAAVPRLSDACRQLSRALLADVYGVSWWVPDGHLIPPVTNRVNYIHWLHDLLSLCPGTAHEPTLTNAPANSPLTLMAAGQMGSFTWPATFTLAADT